MVHLNGNKSCAAVVGQRRQERISKQSFDRLNRKQMTCFTVDEPRVQHYRPETTRAKKVMVWLSTRNMQSRLAETDES